MTPETFLAEFGHFADAPNGVQKLRELILQLAVQGKLVPQDPGDEPAADLLAKLQATRPEEKRKRGRSAKGADLPELAEPFGPPSNWQWARFDQTATIASNLVPPDGHGHMPHVAPDNIEKATGRLLPYRTVAEDGVRSGNHLFFAGQILYSKIRPNLAKATIVDFDGLCSADMYPINALIDAQFLLRYMLSNTFLNMAVKNDTRVAMPKINQTELSRILVPVPPLAEQERIVAKVDQLMALCDEFEVRKQQRREARVRLNNAALDALLNATAPDDFAAHWQRIGGHFDLLYDHPETIAKLRAAILQLAVQGKLVPQDPGDEPASRMLDRIFAHRSQLVTSGALRPRKSANRTNGAIPKKKLPADWEWTTFGEATICRDGERIPLSRAVREGRKGPYDYYGASGVIDSIDDYLFDEPLLLIGEDGANLINRTTPIAFMASGKYWVNNHAHVIDAITKDFLVYLALFINATDLKPYVTGTAQPKMNQAKMNSIPLSLPPEKEQKRIVAKVDQLIDLCDALEAKLNQAQEQSEQLMDATVRQFVGQVPTPAPSPAPRRAGLAPPKTAAPPTAPRNPRAAPNGNIPQSILAHMRPGTAYSRADIVDALGISAGDWNWAIRQLRESGKVERTGQRRGARYTLTGP